MITPSHLTVVIHGASSPAYATGARRHEWFAHDGAEPTALCACRAGRSLSTCSPVLRASLGMHAFPRVLAVQAGCDVAALLFNWFTDPVARRSVRLRGVIAFADVDARDEPDHDATCIADRVVGRRCAMRVRRSDPARRHTVVRLRRHEALPGEAAQELFASLGAIDAGVRRVWGRVCVAERPGVQLSIQGALGAYGPNWWERAATDQGFLRIVTVAQHAPAIDAIVRRCGGWQFVRSEE